MNLTTVVIYDPKKLQNNFYSHTKQNKYKCIQKTNLNVF